jgi:biotin synthase-related radical SAM superfamily protein
MVDNAAGPGERLAVRQEAMSRPTFIRAQRSDCFQRAISRATALGPGMPVFSRAAKPRLRLKTSRQPFVNSWSAVSAA